MLISHKGHTDTIQVYSVTVMTHVKALQAGHSSQGTSEPITPVIIWGKFSQYALQILDFTLNMPQEILGPVAPPTLKDPEYLPRGGGGTSWAPSDRSIRAIRWTLFVRSDNAWFVTDEYVVSLPDVEGMNDDRSCVLGASLVDLREWLPLCTK